MTPTETPEINDFCPEVLPLVNIGDVDFDHGSPAEVLRP
jgi:hypothetical protein